MIPESIRAICGRWRPRDSSVLIEIWSEGDDLFIRAVDTDDGEQLQVVDLSWDAEKVTFVVITPSTRWTVNQELRPQANGSILCATTVVEEWERTG